MRKLYEQVFIVQDSPNLIKSNTDDADCADFHKSVRICIIHEICVPTHCFSLIR